jgi:hypothetical protein
MDEVVQASVIENIADGPVDCQIVVAGDGFAVVGQGTVEKVVKGKGKRRGRYKKIDDLMVRAATVLVAHGFTPLQLMRLFQLARRTKTAREEIEKIMEASERKRREQQKISAASLREEWEGEPLSTEAETTTKEGYSLRSGVRRYRS